MSMDTHFEPDLVGIFHARNGCDPPRFIENRSNAAFTVVIIDKRTLFSECLLVALQNIDTSNNFVRCANVSELVGHYNLESKLLVVFCLSSEDPQARYIADYEIIADLKNREPTINFVIISDQERPDQIVKALDSGARGYIPMSLPLEVAAQALRLICAGGIFIPASSLVDLANNWSTTSASSRQDVALFSPRQVSVAKALRKGTPNKMIAYQLNMCESTVKVHVRHIMKKLKAKNRTEVAFLTNKMFPVDS